MGGGSRSLHGASLCLCPCAKCEETEIEEADGGESYTRNLVSTTGGGHDGIPDGDSGNSVNESDTSSGLANDVCRGQARRGGRNRNKN
jgi:hypothetical protein